MAEGVLWFLQKHGPFRAEVAVYIGKHLEEAREKESLSRGGSGGPCFSRGLHCPHATCAGSWQLPGERALMLPQEPDLVLILH